MPNLAAICALSLGARSLDRRSDVRSGRIRRLLSGLIVEKAFLLLASKPAILIPFESRKFFSNASREFQCYGVK